MSLEISSLNDCRDHEIFRFLAIDLIHEYENNSVKTFTFEFYMLKVVLALSLQQLGVVHFPHTLSQITQQVLERASRPGLPSRVSENEKLGNLSNEEFITIAIQAIRYNALMTRYYSKEDKILELMGLLLREDERIGKYVISAFDSTTLLAHGNKRLRLGKYLGMWDWTFYNPE